MRSFTASLLAVSVSPAFDVAGVEPDSALDCAGGEFAVVDGGVNGPNGHSGQDGGLEDVDGVFHSAGEGVDDAALSLEGIDSSDPVVAGDGDVPVSGQHSKAQVGVSADDGSGFFDGEPGEGTGDVVGPPVGVADSPELGVAGHGGSLAHRGKGRGP